MVLFLLPRERGWGRALLEVPWGELEVGPHVGTKCGPHKERAGEDHEVLAYGDEPAREGCLEVYLEILAPANGAAVSGRGAQRVRDYPV